ncbi:MAG: hypothetical protein H7Z42_02800 [Roseiflexaceae bacterium]|nr:hypothetical protein [Roseiflexaceae bacterium]
MLLTTPLAALTGGNLHTGLPISADSPLVLDKPARDRLVLNDPSCAALVRRVIAPEDIHPWRTAFSRFLIGIPHGWTGGTLGHGLAEDAAWSGLATRHFALAKYLRPREQALREQPHGAFWWELPPYSVDWFATPSIVWASTAQELRPAFSLEGAYLLAGIAFTTAPSAFLLGYLGSAAGRTAARTLGGLDAETLSRLHIPQLGDEAEARVAALAEQLVEHTAELAALEQATRQKIMRDLAPAGATAGPRLLQWWQLSFEEFLSELAHRFKGDVPFRYREGWQQYLNEQRRAHFASQGGIAQLEEQLNQLF